MNKDMINILREIRGTGTPGEAYTNGIWYELTTADTNGNPGIYGDILAKYGVVTESAGTFDQAVAILEDLNVVVTTLSEESNATSSLINGVWYLGIPRGAKGADGSDGADGINGLNGKSGLTPTIELSYNDQTGDLEFEVSYIPGSEEILEEW